MAEEKKEMNIQLILKDIRISYVHLFEARYYKDDVTGRESWNQELEGLVPKRLPDASKNPQVAQIQKAIKDAIAARWPGGDKTIPAERRCFVDGEPIDPDSIDEDTGKGVRKPLRPETEGMMLLRCKSKADGPTSGPVQILGPKKTAKNDKGEPVFPKLKQSDGLIYSGCRANLVVTIYGYDGKKNGNPDRVNCAIEVVQFKAHGEPFGRKQVDANNLLDEEDDDEDGAPAGKSGGTIDDDDDDLV